MFDTLTIRRKISILLTILVIVILYLSASRIVFLRDKEQLFLSLAESNRVTFEAINVLRTTSLDLEVLAQQVTGAKQEQALETAQDALEIAMNDSRDEFARIGMDNSETSDIGLKLDALHRQMDKAIESRRTHLATVSEMNTKNASLAGLFDVFQSHLQRLNAARFSGLAQGSSSSRSGIGSRGRSIAIDAEIAIRLRIQMAAFLDRGRYLIAAADLPHKRAVVAEIVPLLGALVRTLGEAGEFPERLEILQTVREIRAAIQGNDGVQAASEIAMRWDGEFAAAREDMAAALAATTQTLSDLAAASESEVATVYDTARREARRAIFNELLLSWGIGLGLVVTVWQVFLQQVSRRIEVLSADVLRIADGDLDTPCTIRGKDEIGRMADALSTFRRNARELRRSNEELRNFAYVASHDLRSPLRAIRDLVEWTIEDSDDLNPEARENLELIQGRVDRLSQLLSDLLNYARADMTEARATPVDMAQMVRDIGEISDPDGYYNLTFTGITPVMTYPTPLRTVLLNLVSNAIKHHDRPQGQVRVACHTSKGRIHITVSDDGPGIPLRYQDKVFEMFQTLRTKDEIDGSGMGLAIVRKLVLALEGQITLASSPDDRRGTAFTLNIPVPADTNAWIAKDSRRTEGAAA